MNFTKKFMIVPVVALMLLISACGDSEKEQVRKGLEMGAEEFNKTAPHQIDEFTTAEKVVVGDGLHVSYYYTINQEAYIDAVGEDNLSQLVSAIAEIIKQQSCVNKEMRTALGLGAEFEYIYKTTTGRELGDIKVTEKDCKE